MAFKILLITCITLAAMLETTEAICYNVATNTGVRNLEDNEYACRPLAEGQSSSELGRDNWRCVAGIVYNFTCPGSLRLNNAGPYCDWPSTASCDRNPAFGQAATANTDSTITTTTPAPPAKCSPSNCQLPSCFCYGDKPSYTGSEDSPMFVMLTYDDAVVPSVYNVYQKFLLSNNWNLYNPNNCSIKATFFITHTYTDYSLVQNLYNSGHEIADHTINHVSEKTTYDEVAAEIVGLRDIIVNKTTIPSNEIKGFRSPYLKIFGDVQFDVLKNSNFMYDSSIPNIELQVGRKPIWPHTLDFPIEDSRCPNRPCPTKPHPGVWEVPMNSWVGSNGFSCSMIDGCAVRDNEFNGTKEEFLAYYRN
ncbi:hypothetical protein Btru_043997 [Bulinus truncatus]|nr:hypothetical protein Btru_043997 [Bulinus truncatus]